jgi:PKD repeat protein
MKALLRPGFVLGLSIAISATSLLGASSVAFAATTRPTITDWPVTLTVNEGDKPTIQVTFTDTDGPGFYAYDVFWGDGDSSSGTISEAETGLGPWTFHVTKSTAYAAGVFTLQISVNHGGPANTRFGTVTVLSNQTPSVVSFGVTAGSEGGTSTLALTFADSDALDTHTVSVVWGDGFTAADPVVLPAGETTFGAEHVYAGTGPYAVVLTLKDSANHTVTAGASVSPTNVAPVLGALSLSPSLALDHQVVTLSGSFTDPGTSDTFTLTVDWGAGALPPQPLGTEHSFSVTHAYDAAGPVTITATVEDHDGGKSSSSVDLVVLPSNHAPADLLVGATTLLEGGSTTLSVSFTDAEALDTHTVAINWGDGSTFSVPLTSGVTSTSPTHTYLETGTYAIAVTVTDGGGMWVSGGTTVTAINVPPSLSSLVVTPPTVTDHQALTVSGTFSDSGTADTFTVLFTWGDGSTSTQSLAAGTRSFSASHEYATAGTDDITVTVTDRDKGFGSQYVSVVVTARNTAPSALTLDPSVAGPSVTVNASFTDPDALDTHRAVVTWGDNTSTTQDLVAGATTFDASHVYEASGTYTVTATVTEPAGALTTASTRVGVTVPADSASDVVDQMSALVLSFDLDRNTERWLLKKLDDLKGSLAYGNSQVCASSGTLNHVLTFAQRTLTSEQYAALNALATKLEAAAGCTSQGNQPPKVLKAPTVKPTAVTPTVVTPAPTPKKDTTATTTKSGSKPTEGRKAR